MISLYLDGKFTSYTFIYHNIWNKIWIYPVYIIYIHHISPYILPIIVITYTIYFTSGYQRVMRVHHDSGPSPQLLPAFRSFRSGGLTWVEVSDALAIVSPVWQLLFEARQKTSENHGKSIGKWGKQRKTRRKIRKPWENDRIGKMRKP